jgi:hypothetical protein
VLLPLVLDEDIGARIPFLTYIALHLCSPEWVLRTMTLLVPREYRTSGLLSTIERLIAPIALDVRARISASCSARPRLVSLSQLTGGFEQASLCHSRHAVDLSFPVEKSFGL